MLPELECFFGLLPDVQVKMEGYEDAASGTLIIPFSDGSYIHLLADASVGWGKAKSGVVPFDLTGMTKVPVGTSMLIDALTELKTSLTRVWRTPNSHQLKFVRDPPQSKEARYWFSGADFRGTVHTRLDVPVSYYIHLSSDGKAVHSFAAPPPEAQKYLLAA